MLMKTVTLELTCVEFVPHHAGDTLVAFLSLLPVGVVWSVCTHALMTRQLTPILLFLAIVTNECVNLAIKHSYKEPRPLFSQSFEDGRVRHRGWGMPSAHTQFSFHLLTLLVLHSYVYKRLKFSHLFYTHLMIVCGLLLAVGVGWSRVYLEYHSMSQVFAGGLLGVLMGLILYYFIFNHFYKWNLRIVNGHCVGLVETLLGYVYRWFRVHDTVPVPNLIAFEQRVVRMYQRDPKIFPDVSDLKDE